MATITLYANKINQMPTLISNIKQSVVDYKAELAALSTKTLSINQNVCNLDDVINSIQASTQTQEERIASLDTFQASMEDFIVDVVRIDGEVSELIKQRKDEFYSRHSYLKPDIEKNGWDNFVDGLSSAADWCKDNWKAIVTVVLVVVAVVLICTGIGGIFAPILLGIANLIISGAIVGGVLGGISCLIAGGSFWEGFINGAFTGALMGGLFGGLSGLGFVLGSSCRLFGNSTLLNQIIPYIAKTTTAISLSMAGFDLLAWGAGLFNPDNALTAFNHRLHSSKTYNTFQISISALAAFTSGFNVGLQNQVCFVAGTMILTATGVVEIERIRAGDKVISTNIETDETAEKNVVETYIRESGSLVHVWVDGSETLVTPEHPYWVQSKGWVIARELAAGDQLRKSCGKLVTVQEIELEELEKPVTVYNLQVEDFHTYYAGSVCVLVHNANNTYNRPSGHRKGVREESWENAKSSDGIVRDPLTKRPIDSNNPWDMGHRPGYEFRKHQASAAERGISRRQFLDEHNNPNHYRPELPSSNRSGLAEDPTNLYLGP